LTTVFGTARFLNVRTKRQVTPFPIYRFSTTALSETRPWNKNAAKIIQIPHSKALEWKIIRATASNAIICEDFDEIIGVEGGLEEPFP
jgi:hypothetical protein